MPDYIPRDEPTKIQWLANFTTWVNANGATHGLSPTEVNDLLVTAGTANTAFGDNVTAQAAAKAATAAKNTALGAYIAMARDYAQRLQNNPNMSNQDRAAAGLTVPDSKPTKSAADDVLTISAPLLMLDFSVRRQVTVHWGPNPSNERENGRPSGTIGCQVQYAHGGIPAEESAWTALEIDTESPIIHTVPDTTPTTYAYRARYVGKNLKMGPYGDPAVCTVSV
jgi:hypothetical protein